jgi:hypothetical protein
MLLLSPLVYWRAGEKEGILETTLNYSRTKRTGRSDAEQIIEGKKVNSVHIIHHANTQQFTIRIAPVKRQDGFTT